MNAGLIDITNNAKKTSLVLCSDTAKFKSAIATALQSLPTTLATRTIFSTEGPYHGPCCIRRARYHTHCCQFGDNCFEYSAPDV